MCLQVRRTPGMSNGDRTGLGHTPHAKRYPQGWTRTSACALTAFSQHSTRWETEPQSHGSNPPPVTYQRGILDQRLFLAT